jgi:hypothetical protein
LFAAYRVSSGSDYSPAPVRKAGLPAAPKEGSAARAMRLLAEDRAKRIGEPYAVAWIRVKDDVRFREIAELESRERLRSIAATDPTMTPYQAASALDDGMSR